MTKEIRVIIIGFGIQGKKRNLIAGNDVVCIIDPIVENMNIKDVRDVPLDSFDAALICTNNKEKIGIIRYLLSNNKNILVEKPFISNTTNDLVELSHEIDKKKLCCYTAYNHRFEPHFINMKNIVQSEKLGKLYHLRLFYGNGTANLVKNSPWRDKNTGVLCDLGSHLFDTLAFWINDIKNYQFVVTRAEKKENSTFDHVVINNVAKKNQISIELEMSLISWKNTFTCDFFGEKGSAHINSLCKWGPSEFIHRSRIYPSGKPNEKKITLEQNDPTWSQEYKHFLDICKTNQTYNIEKDIWINETLLKLSDQVNIREIV